MANYDGTITLNTRVDTKGIKSGASQIKSGLSGIGPMLGKIGAAVGIAFGVRSLINFGKQAVSLASDIEEVQNVVDVAFGDMTYKMEQFADTAIETYGISKLTAKRTGSTYMAMAKGMGMAGEQAADMSLSLTALSADMASFFNKSQEMTDIALKAVFTGETEVLKQYGIVMTQVNLQEFARQQGITKTIDKMNQQEQVMLRYNYIMQQTTLAQGDFYRTQDSWANQTRILSERWKEMQSVFGEAFMTIGTLILPAINTLIKGLTYVANIAKVAAVNIAALFGKKIDTTSSNVAGNTAAISSGLGSAAGNASDTAGGVSDIGKAAKKTNKEIKKTVASFDELQILSSETASGAGGGGSGAAGGGIGDMGIGAMTDGDFDPQAYATEISTALSTIMGVIGLSLCAVGLILIFSGNIPWGIGFIVTGATMFAVSAFALSGKDPTNEAINGLATLMGVAGGALAAIGIFLCFMGSWAWGIGFIIAGAAMLGVGIAAISKSKTSDIKTWVSLVSGIASGALLALGIILVVFGVITPLSIGLIVAGAVGLAGTIALNNNAAKTAITNWIKDNSGLIVGVSLALLVLGIVLCLCGVITPLSIGLIVAGAVGLATTISLNWSEIKNKVTNFLKENQALIVGVSLALLVLGVVLCCCGVVTPLSIGLIATGAVGLATEVALNWNAMKEKVSTFIKDNQALFMGIGAALVVLGIICLFTGVGIPIGIGLIVTGAVALTSAADVDYDGFKDKIVTFLSATTSIISASLLVLGIICLFTGGGIPIGLGLILAGCKGISTAEKWDSNGITRKIKDFVNGIIEIFERGVNYIINKINSISLDIPDWVPGIGGGKLGFNIPKLKVPRLAQGTVLPPNKPFMAIVGDQKSGTNIEAPLDTIKQALFEVMQANGGGNQPVIIEIDGREFGRAVLSHGNRESHRTSGKLVFG